MTPLNLKNTEYYRVESTILQPTDLAKSYAFDEKYYNF